MLSVFSLSRQQALNKFALRQQQHACQLTGEQKAQKGQHVYYGFSHVLIMPFWPLSNS